jgi:hypothetical protein
MTQEIYCDESGFTGNDLSNIQTPYYSYASVAVSHCEAEQFVKYLINKYQIQNSELKFEKLKKYKKGRKAISEMLERYANCTRLVIHHKKYNLACKFYEYVFEPVLADKNSIFYSIKFNQFISNLIYLHIQTEPQSAEDLFSSFEKMMRYKNIEELETLFCSSKISTVEGFLNLIRIFCINHQDIISEELESLNGTSTGKWILDLTSSSLVALLGEWGQQFQELEVFCDQSKPLKEQPDFFKAMIGNSNRIFMEIAGKKHPLSFNLKKEINFVDSKYYYGIQIADVFAGVSAFVFKERLNNNSVRSSIEIPSVWIDNISNSLSDYSVFPDIENLNFDKTSTQLNLILFNEIINRTINQKPILEGIEDYIRQVNILLLYYPLKAN